MTEEKETIDAALAALWKANGEILRLKKIIKRQNAALAAASQKLKEKNPLGVGRVIQHVERVQRKAEEVIS